MRKNVALVSTLALLSLAACGGGGTGGGAGPVVVAPPAPVTAGPASTSTADLVAFANEGSSRSLGGGVTRTQKTVTVDGQTVTVAVDSLPGYGNGLVQYRSGNDVSVYTVAGEPVANIQMPSGSYNGPLTLNYRADANGSFQVAMGEMNFVLNMETGAVAIGGIAGNSNNNIEFFADAQAVDGAFVVDDSIVRLRDGNGVFITDHAGTVNGTLATGPNGSAIFGTVTAEGTDGFLLNGGYTAIHEQ